MTALWRLQVLAANQSPAQKKWFQGTADAVRQYLWLFENSMREGIEDFLILAGESAFTNLRAVAGISRSVDMILSPLNAATHPGSPLVMAGSCRRLL